MVDGLVRDVPAHRRRRRAGPLARFRFPAGRGFFAGLPRPGVSSPDGWIALLPLLPLLRDRTSSSFATCSRSAAIWSDCAPAASRSSSARSSSSATRSCRAAHPARSSSAGGRTVTGHDHLRSAHHSRRRTLSRLRASRMVTKTTIRHHSHPNSRITSSPPLPD